MLIREDIERALVNRAGRDEAFRALLLENPRDAVREALNISVPSHFTLEVHEEDASSLHLVLPPGDRLSEEELASVAGGKADG